jgi:hypothetical protein
VEYLKCLLPVFPLRRKTGLVYTDVISILQNMNSLSFHKCCPEKKSLSFSAFEVNFSCYTLRFQRRFGHLALGMRLAPTNTHWNFWLTPPRLEMQLILTHKLFEDSMSKQLDDLFGAVVRILAYSVRGRGCFSRTVQRFVCMKMSICFVSRCQK